MSTEMELQQPKTTADSPVLAKFVWFQPQFKIISIFAGCYLKGLISNYKAMRLFNKNLSPYFLQTTHI